MRALIAGLLLCVAPAGAFILSSAAFDDGASIPVEYTCDGSDRSPPLRWSDPPAEAKAFAVSVDDPDAPAGTFLHWTLYDLPAATRALPAGDRAAGLEGRNGFGRFGWAGPCPPPGAPHRYVFTVYALPAPVGMPPATPVAELRRRIESTALGRATLTGRFGR